VWIVAVLSLGILFAQDLESVLRERVAEPKKIPKQTRAQIEAADNEVLFSAASLWEVALKVQTGRLELPVPLDELSTAAEEMGFVELPVRSAHAVHVARLPLHHHDPFDRLLVAQAILEPARLLTVDGPLRQYSELVDLVTT
jgi:PIN domain nuclease of toxin-antitoxin system